MTKGTKPRIAFVVPRFDPDLAGGAEVLAKGFARRLVQRGYSVAVFTTCARDHFTWENHYPSGEFESGGIRVTRFLEIQEKIVKYQDLSFEEEKEWVSQSVVSESLFKHIEESRDSFDVFIFVPYLFGTTYWGAQIVDEKAILIPCLHDEPYAHLKIFKELFDNVKAVMFNTEAERLLGKRLYDLPDWKTCVVGMGMEPSGAHDADRFRKNFRLSDPFVLYAGRREGGKNSDFLVEYFRVFKRHNRLDAKLAMMGTGSLSLQPIDAKYVVDFGYLSEEDKRDAFAAASVFCQPSLNESLSIVLMEAWLAETPALVNAKCAVTVEHCVKSNGGLFFDDYCEFEETLSLLLTNRQLAATLGKNGAEYVRKEYNWNTVMGRFEEGLANFGFA